MPISIWRTNTSSLGRQMANESTFLPSSVTVVQLFFWLTERYFILGGEKTVLNSDMCIMNKKKSGANPLPEKIKYDGEWFVFENNVHRRMYQVAGGSITPIRGLNSGSWNVTVSIVSFVKMAYSQSQEFKRAKNIKKRNNLR